MDSANELDERASEAQSVETEVPHVDPLSNLRSGVVTLDPELKNSSLYLVFQIFKVLQGDPDKVQDYYRTKLKSQYTDPVVDAERLGRFLQPLGTFICLMKAL